MGGEGGAAGIRANFETSLHKTRAGKEFWYTASNNGMETLTGAAYDDFACKSCHNKKDPSWAGEATCADCHDNGGMGGAGGGGGMALPKHLDPQTCLGCHGRQNAEANRIQGMDFHMQMEFACQDCHGSNEVHGNGTEYDSMLRPGAIATRCTDCHVDGGPGTLPPDDSFHAATHAALDCALCHTETVISCLNCHVEEDLDNQDKCAAGQVFNWKFVMKWDKDGGDNEVYHPATLMTLKFACDRAGAPNECPPDAIGGPDKTFAVFAPYYAHTVTQQAIDTIKAAPPAFGQDGCGYCHNGAANCDTIANAGGINDKQKLIAFEGTGGAGGMQTGRLTNPISGLIPLPADYRQRFEIDFVEYQAGPGNVDCADDEGKPIPLPLVYLETGPDMWQTGEDTTAPNTAEMGHPLDQDEMRKFCPGFTLLPAP
jgi:hypothetical protein